MALLRRDCRIPAVMIVFVLGLLFITGCTQPYQIQPIPVPNHLTGEVHLRALGAEENATNVSIRYLMNLTITNPDIFFSKPVSGTVRITRPRGSFSENIDMPGFYFEAGPIPPGQSVFIYRNLTLDMLPEEYASLQWGENMDVVVLMTGYKENRPDGF